MAIGTRVRQLISKSASANQTRRNITRITTDNGGFEVQGTDVSFTSPATISSAGNAFPTGLKAGNLIVVTGSALNSRTWELATVSAGSLTVVQQQVQTESAGPLIDVRTV
jgi:hypothetical protein